MYSVSICEASKNVRDSLEKIIKCYFTTKGIKVKIKSYSHPVDLSSNSLYSDIVFLDMDNNEVDIQTSYILHKKNPGMYLYILSDKYTHLDKAMDLNAFRYIKKDLDVHRIISSLDIIVSQGHDIMFMSNYSPVHLKYNDIACIYSKERHSIVLTSSGTKYPTTISIKDWLSKISDSNSFLHPHYSYIVNKNYISSFDGKIITIRCKDGKTMNVYPSQRKIANIKRFFYQTADN